LDVSWGRFGLVFSVCSVCIRLIGPMYVVVLSI